MTALEAALRWADEAQGDISVGSNGGVQPYAYALKTLAATLRERDQAQDKCMPFYGSKSAQGYGMVNFGTQTIRAHRAAYRLFHGKIPNGMFVCHSCDNPPCINPKHLFLGTAKDNAMDCRQKGRNPSTKKTHCPRGHAYFGKNLIVNKHGRRFCRACKKLSDAKSTTNIHRLGPNGPLCGTKYWHGETDDLKQATCKNCLRLGGFYGLR